MYTNSNNSGTIQWKPDIVLLDTFLLFLINYQKTYDRLNRQCNIQTESYSIRLQNYLQKNDARAFMKIRRFLTDKVFFCAFVYFPIKHYNLLTI